LKASKDGRALRQADRSNVSVAEDGQDIEEPVGWRTTLPDDDQDRVIWGDTPWASIHPFYQRRIEQKLQSHPP
jgi:hypothetical protein